jgi:hypothetical protein
VTCRSNEHPCTSAPATSSRLPVTLPPSGAGAGQQLPAIAEARRQAFGCTFLWLPAFRVSGAAASQCAGMSPRAARVFGRAKTALPNIVLAKTPSLSLRLSVFASGENAHYLPTTRPAQTQTWCAPVCFVGRWWVSVSAARRPLATTNTALPTMDPPSPITAHQEHTA